STRASANASQSAVRSVQRATWRSRSSESGSPMRTFGGILAERCLRPGRLGLSREDSVTVAHSPTGLSTARAQGLWKSRRPTLVIFFQGCRSNLVGLLPSELED